jgi:hypothetical protein
MGAARIFWLALAAGAVLAVLMHPELVLNLGSDIPKDLGDPLPQAWQIAWGGHALANQPFDFFQSNMYWPLRNTLAFSEANVGYAPLGLIGQGPHAAVVRYDLVYLFAYALAFAGAFCLAWELGAGTWGAAVAGAAFAYAPWRLEQDGHLHVISSGALPLTLFLLVRGYRRASPGLVVTGWLVAAWQLSLGFTLGLQLGYLLFALGVIALLLRAPLPSRRVLVATAAGALIIAVVGYVLAQPYFAVRDDHPEAARTLADVAHHSGPLVSFLAAPDESLVWDGVTTPARDELSFVPEQTLFPGLAILALALVGLGSSAYPRRLRIGLGAGVLGCALLSLGFQEHGWQSWLPYRVLYELAPGWDSIRVPGRLHTLTTLGLALLAGAGALRINRGRAWLGALLVALVLLDGAGFGREPRVPEPPPGLADVAGPRVHIPLYTYESRRYLLWSTDGFPKIVNGRGSIKPRSFVELEKELAGFPDARSVAALERLGVRNIVLHPDLVAGTTWERWAERPLSGLPLRERPANGFVVFRLTRP